LLTVSIVFETAADIGIYLYLFNLWILNHFRFYTTFTLSYQLIFHCVIKGNNLLIFVTGY
jgi:hypothetical protein